MESKTQPPPSPSLKTEQSAKQKRLADALKRNLARRKQSSAAKQAPSSQG